MTLLKLNIDDIVKAVDFIQQGGVIAYPTEAVYGLGCDPFDEQAVKRLLQFKQRSIEKGLIVIAAKWEHVQDWVQPLSEDLLARAKMTWPGPFTWTFPASSLVPVWIRGDHTTVAIRLTAHPIARALCQQFNKPIVSTSANIANNPPARSAEEVLQIFNDKLDYVLAGALGGAARPTEIRDILTGNILRGG